jgi:hypothetical protein
MSQRQARIRSTILRLSLIAAAALWLAACSTPESSRIASECGPKMGAAASCTDWYSGGN